MKTDLFVYYKAQAGDAAAIAAHVSRLQAGLGLPASLHRRPEEKEGLHTWMEVYRAIPEDFAARLTAVVDGDELASLIVGERHYEFFLEVATCA
jgi:hypothetical protein